MNKTVHVPAFNPDWTSATSTRGCLGRQVRSSSWRGAFTSLHHDAEYMSEPVSMIQDRLTWGRRPYMSNPRFSAGAAAPSAARKPLKHSSAALQQRGNFPVSVRIRRCDGLWHCSYRSRSRSSILPPSRVLSTVLPNPATAAAGKHARTHPRRNFRRTQRTGCHAPDVKEKQQLLLSPPN